MRMTLGAGTRLFLRVAVLALIALACVLLVRRLDPARLGRAFAEASLPLVGVAVAVNFVQLGARALFLRVLLAPVRVVGVARLYGYNLALFGANNLLPARAGEWVRIELLRAHEGIPRPTGIAVALVEKVLDALALLALALPLPLLLPGLPRSVAVATSLLGAGGVLGLVAVRLFATRASRASGRWAELAAGAAAVRDARTLRAAIGWAVASHILDAAAIFVCLRAMHLPLPAPASLLVLLAVTMVLALPSAPAGVGSLEVSAVGALALLGVDATRALAFALVYHAMQVLPVTLLGLLALRSYRRAPAASQ